MAVSAHVEPPGRPGGSSAFEKHLEDGKHVFLKLWKPGCGACKLSEPAVRRLEENHSETLTFGGINAEEFPEILEIFEFERQVLGK